MSKKNCGCSQEQVDTMFRKAEPYIDQQIQDRTCELKRYLVDMVPIKNFEEGIGTSKTGVRFFSDPGPGASEDGFEGWRKVETTRSAEESALKGEHSGCAWDPECVGFGMESYSIDLMERDLCTKPICVNDIRTFFQYQTVQNLIFSNLTNITANIRESFNREALCSLNIKHIAMPNFPVNKADPRQLIDNIPSGAVVGKLTYRLLKHFYPYLAREAGCHALTSLDGMPAFGVMASPDTIHDLVYDDPEIRKDMRYCSGRSCDLLSKYNLTDSMGPFIFIPDMGAKRYNRDENGNLYRVLPVERDVPIEIGTRSVASNEYNNAEFELVNIVVKDMFSLVTRNSISSVGGMTNFDAAPGLGSWKWHNPERLCDPYRKTGQYVNHLELGIDPDGFTDSISILVRRRPANNSVSYWGPEECPPDETDCMNVLPDGPCPCPAKISCCITTAEDELLFGFAPDPVAAVGDVVKLKLDNGGDVEVEVTAVNGHLVQVKFPNPVTEHDGKCVVGILCSERLICDAEVKDCSLCKTADDLVGLVLCSPLSAAAGETVTVTFGNGEKADVAVSEVDSAKHLFWVEVPFVDFCEKKGLKHVCIPPATNPDCPECDPQPEPCVEEPANASAPSEKKASKAKAKKPIK